MALGLVAVMLVATNQPAMAAESAEPDVATIPHVDRDLLPGFLADNSSVTLIDARSEAEFTAQHLPGAINLPYDEVAAKEAVLPDDLAAPVLVYCRTGKRAGMLRQQLISRGYSNVQVLPREQIFWRNGFMALNCSTESARAQMKSADAKSPWFKTEKADLIKIALEY